LSLGLISQNYILIDKAFTAWNVLIVILAIIGIALYMYGYLRREATDETISEVITLSIFLVVWGVFTYFIGQRILSTYILPTDVEMRALTI
jgi:membrane protein implicated in regulation of membrane protease activity